MELPSTRARIKLKEEVLESRKDLPVSNLHITGEGIAPHHHTQHQAYHQATLLQIWKSNLVCLCLLEDLGFYLAFSVLLLAKVFCLSRFTEGCHLVPCVPLTLGLSVSHRSKFH